MTLRELLFGCGGYILACISITIGAFLRGLSGGYR